MADGDLELFRALRLDALACDPDSFGGTFENESRRTQQEWSNFFARSIGPGQTVVAALQGNRALGMCGAFIADADASIGRIWGMFVSPAARGTGVADALIEAAEAFLRDRGARRVSASVSDGNRRAIAFYRRRGYVIGAQCSPLREGSLIQVHPIEKLLA